MLGRGKELVNRGVGCYALRGFCYTPKLRPGEVLLRSGRGIPMNHKFRGQQCVYCGAEAETSDHTIGRNFFLVERRSDLPQVPACRRCNNEKSKHENYLMIVLAFGAKHPDAAENLRTLVAHRLENKANAKLLRKLQKG
jgi:hypothetical protein